jgi:hypothetical protein
VLLSLLVQNGSGQFVEKLRDVLSVKTTTTSFEPGATWNDTATLSAAVLNSFPTVAPSDSASIPESLGGRLGTWMSGGALDAPVPTAPFPLADDPVGPLAGPTPETAAGAATGAGAGIGAGGGKVIGGSGAASAVA